MPSNDDNFLPNIRARRRKSSVLILVIVILPILMTYSTALLATGFSPQITIGIATAACGLTITVLRRFITGAPPTPASPTDSLGDL